MNIFNVALITRVFLFFAYPTKMSGDQVWVAKDSILGIGGTNSQFVDGFSGATPLGQLSVAEKGNLNIADVLGNPIGIWDAIIGLIPGSIGETSVIAIALGAFILLLTGVASWKIMFSVFAGGASMAFLFNHIGISTSLGQFPWYYHLLLGGFAFGAVFMATDPVTASRTETGKWIYGFLIGVMTIIIRVLNPGYPEGMMLAILLMNVFAPLIDYYVVQANINRRAKRAVVTIKKQTDEHK
jgi:Na+-transporting NADH:ubiquinone oxidoreductase subunit B